MLSDNNHSVKLPDEFQKYFWDVAFDELTIEKYPRFIAERILNYGNMNGIKWLLSWADKHYLRTLVENSRNLNVKTKNFWQIMLA
jgi:hypothetical protein